MCVCVRVQLASPHPCTQCLPVLPSDSSQFSHGASSITSSAFPQPLTVALGSVLELTAPIIPQQTQPYKKQGLFWSRGFWLDIVYYLPNVIRNLCYKVKREVIFYFEGLTILLAFYFDTPAVQI